MGVDRSTVRAQELESARIPPPYPSIEVFVAAIKRGDERALAAFFVHYTPLLTYQARRLGVAPHEVSELVTTVLDDIAMQFSHGLGAPRELTRFLVVCLRNAARKWKRTLARHDARLTRARTSSNGESVVAECHSEYALHAAQGVDVVDVDSLNRALDGLTRFAMQELTDVDRELVVATSNHIPLRDVAPPLGLTYAAARVRLHRLRMRLTRLAQQYANGLDANERLEVQRFLRRAGLQRGTMP
jgi:DNA-directed RNA polymerase specialized sigma24 family protein